MSLDRIKVSHFGYLAAAPELRYTADQTPVVNFRVLTTSRRKGKDGAEDKEYTNGVRWECWEESAENIAKLLKRGSHVYIEGELRNDSYEDPKNPGQTIYRDRFIVKEWKLLDRKDPTGNPAASGAGGEPHGDDLGQD